MIHSFITFIEQIVLPMGALGVFLAEVIEEIVVPIPSALVLLASGFIFLRGDLTIDLISKLIFIIAIPAALGLTVGSLFIYAFSFYGGKPFIEKFGNFLGIKWEDILVFDEKMNKTNYDEYIFIFARIIPIVPSSLIAIFAGVTRVPLRKYILLTLAGSFVKAIIYGFSGYLVGDLYSTYALKIAEVEKWGLALIVLILLAFILYRAYRKK